jgi:hypothetical protein
MGLSRYFYPAGGWHVPESLKGVVGKAKTTPSPKHRRTSGISSDAHQRVAPSLRALNSKLGSLGGEEDRELPRRTRRARRGNSAFRSLTPSCSSCPLWCHTDSTAQIFCRLIQLDERCERDGSPRSMTRNQHCLSQSGQTVAHPIDFMASSNATPPTISTAI